MLERRCFVLVLEVVGVGLRGSMPWMRKSWRYEMCRLMGLNCGYGLVPKR